MLLQLVTWYNAISSLGTNDSRSVLAPHLLTDLLLFFSLFGFGPVLVDVPKGISFVLTDNSWKGDLQGWRSTEGSVAFIVGPEGLQRGDVIVWDGTGSSTAAGGGDVSAGEWVVNGQFNPSSTGDTLLVYEVVNSDPPLFIFGLSYSSSGWIEDTTTTATGQLDSAASTSSVLPTSLQEGRTAIALAHKDNVHYSGPTSGSREELLLSVASVSFWTGDNTDVVDLLTLYHGGFFVEEVPRPNSPVLSPTATPAPPPTPITSSPTSAPPTTLPGGSKGNLTLFASIGGSIGLVACEFHTTYRCHTTYSFHSI
jgi:hypothetical protein